MQYRPEIDGLRAIAVISVILFHAGFSLFRGGYVGVDVFFIISGCFITLSILRRLEQKTFSIIQFYERRARRILPALFFVMLFSCMFAWFWLRPTDMKDFSQSLIATSYFASNFLFWLESGYWDTASNLKPLLHTWTLAIEAQFYLLFPIFLIAVWKLSRRWLLFALIALTLGSFMLAQWGSVNVPSANFFLIPTRLWELTFGAIIGVYLFTPKKPVSSPFSYEFINTIFIRELCGILGILLIAFAIFTFDETIPFPSYLTLIPAVGTALVILFVDAKTAIGQFLKQKHIAGMGLISYSAYLWHQPLFVFARHRSLGEPDKLTTSLLIAFTFVIAYLTWKFVEKPFRNTGFIQRRGLLIFWLIGSITFIEVGVAGHLTEGFASRVEHRQLSVKPIEKIITADFSFPSHGSPLGEVSLPVYFENIPRPGETPSRNYLSVEEWRSKKGLGLDTACDGLFAAIASCQTSANPDILIWGDSHAMHLVPAVMESNPDAKVIQITKSVCGPFFDIAPIAEPTYSIAWSNRCLEFNENLRTWLKQNSSVKYALLSSPFSQYLIPGKRVLLRNGAIANATDELAITEFRSTLEQLISLGIRPVIFSPPPSNGANIGQCLASAQWMGIRLQNCNFPRNDLSRETQVAFQFLKVFQGQYRVVFLDELMCDRSSCKSHLGDVPLYRDHGHLSAEGSILLGKRYDFYRIVTGN